ncbi:MAG: YfhO family protein, partial [Bacteroidetes bacterium]|nr:YfhO family protein [Bacteroidota bacterium]
AYSFASYNLIIIEAGHVTKGYAMAYIAPLIGGVILTYKRKYILGGLVTLLFLGIEIACNHQQITYYAAIMVAGMVGVYFIYAIMQKQLKSFFIASVILVAAAILAALPNLANNITAYHYSKDTMRGGSELTITPESKNRGDDVTPHKDGLEIDYAFAWSYGKMETFTQLVPEMYGGGHVILDKNSETAKELRKIGYGGLYLPTYWGDQPFTSGPVYVGAIVCFLFILGLFIVRGPVRWWVIIVCIISFVLAWGRHFEVVNNFLFYNLPLYNKFRTPSMALIIAGVAMPMLGALALKTIFNNEINREKAWKYTKISLYVSLGLCAFIAFLGAFSFSFVGRGDAGFADRLLGGGFPQASVDNIMDLMIDHRKSMLYHDVLRSMIFITLAFTVLWLFLKSKIKNQKLIIGMLAMLILIDLWGVGKRYLNNDNFQPKKKMQNTYKPSDADLLILQDTDINYRVFNLQSNTYNESITSYFHKSIGGYSPAKLRRYQDMIDFYLFHPLDINVLNMLNAKYIIMQNGQVYPNRDAFGNAWFAQQVIFVDTPDDEILMLADIDLRDTIVVDRRFAHLIEKQRFAIDSTAEIVNTVALPNRMEYQFKSNYDQLVVFSEIFYDKGGWVAYLNGEEVPHFRANYILRAMIVPAGEHHIVFKYIPKWRIIGNRIAGISSWIVILLFAAAAIGWALRTTPLRRNND